MKKTIFSLWVVLTLATFWHLDQLLAQSVDYKAIDTYIENANKDWKIPGLAVGIVKDGELVYAKGFGQRDINEGGKVDGHTLFAIASNSKAFTSTAIGLLVQEGKVKWDDPVTKYLSDFQLYDCEATRKVTLRDLLCHRIGFPTWGGDLTWAGSNYTRREVVNKMRYQKPTFDFRTGYGYCNLAFLAAGEVILEVTGKTWDEFIEERFFDPLGMSRTNTHVKMLGSMKNVATPHTKPKDKLITCRYRDLDNIGPAASINSSVHDLSKWVSMQLNNGKWGDLEIVSEDIIDMTRTPHNLRTVSKRGRQINPATHFSTYGLGWHLSDYHGRLLVQHSGGMDGMLSRVSMLPEEKLGVIILTNSDQNWMISYLQYYLFDRMLGNEFKDWHKTYFDIYESVQEGGAKAKQQTIDARETNTSPGHPLEAYTGTYVSDIYGTAKLLLKEGQLHVDLEGHPNLCKSIEHWHHDTFLAKWNDDTFVESFLYFDLDDDRQIKQFRFSIRPDWIDPLEYTFVKQD